MDPSTSFLTLLLRISSTNKITCEQRKYSMNPLKALLATYTSFLDRNHITRVDKIWRAIVFRWHRFRTNASRKREHWQLIIKEAMDKVWIWEIEITVVLTILDTHKLLIRLTRCSNPKRIWIMEGGKYPTFLKRVWTKPNKAKVSAKNTMIIEFRVQCH